LAGRCLSILPGLRSPSHWASGSASSRVFLGLPEANTAFLILLFGVPIVFAGTLSSLASIPVQFIGLLKHRNLGHTGATTFRLGAVMGAASVVGVALGVVFLGRATEAFVTQVLGLAMILAAVRIVWDIRHPHPAEIIGIPEGA